MLYDGPSYLILSFIQIKQLCSVIIPMREVSVVEKMNTTSIVPSAVHIITKSKVSCMKWVEKQRRKKCVNAKICYQLFGWVIKNLNRKMS